MTCPQLYKLYDREYNAQSYHCGHFVCDVWEVLTGKFLADKLRSLLLPTDQVYFDVSLRHSFIKLKSPVEPCIVIMTRKKYASHTGVFYNNGVLHLQRTGVMFQELREAMLGFDKGRFYTC